MPRPRLTDDVAVAGQRVLDEHHVVARVVEPAPRLVGDADVGQHTSALELHVTDVDELPPTHGIAVAPGPIRSAPCRHRRLVAPVRRPRPGRSVTGRRRGDALGRRSASSGVPRGTTRARLPVGDGHRGTPRSSRLHAPGTSAARSSPGAPHRVGGLPTSEPGLVAGTRDLVKPYARRHPEEIDRSTTWTPPRAGRPDGSRAAGRPDAVVERPAHQSAQPVVGLEVERMIDGYPGPRPVATSSR